MMKNDAVSPNFVFTQNKKQDRIKLDTIALTYYL